jgi:hypothetical protein
MRKVLAIAILFLVPVSTGLAHKNSVQGGAQGITTISASPYTIGGVWSWGNVAVFDLATQYNTLINSGGVPMSITMICVTNSTSENNFFLSGSYTNQPYGGPQCIDPSTASKFKFSIAPGSSEQLGLAFDPQSPGCKYATLEIYGNFASNPQTISLFGDGYESGSLAPNC